MFKKISLGLFAATLLSSALYSKTPPYAAYEFELSIKSKEQIERSNPYFFTVTGECTIHMPPDTSTLLIATVKRSKIYLGDSLKEVKAKEPLALFLHDGSEFKLSASFNSSLQLKNEGEHQIKIICTSDLG